MDNAVINSLVLFYKMERILLAYVLPVLLNFCFLQTNDLGEMLDEDPSLMGRRQELAKRLELYQKARDEINSVYTR